MALKVVTKYEANIAEKNNLSLWHQQLARINCRALREMINENLVNGIKMNDQNAFSFCECCTLGKQPKLPLNKITRAKRTKVGELIHAQIYAFRCR